MQHDDVIRIQHMLDAAEEAQRFIKDHIRDDLDTDRMLSFALVRAIEIIGEAASKVSSETRASLPSIPWTAVVAMRNRVIHAYFDVDLDRVWDTVTDDLPPLINELQHILSTYSKAP